MDRKKGTQQDIWKEIEENHSGLANYLKRVCPLCVSHLQEGSANQLEIERYQAALDNYLSILSLSLVPDPVLITNL